MEVPANAGNGLAEVRTKMQLYMIHRPKSLQIWNARLCIPWAGIDAEVTPVGRMLDAVIRLGRMPVDIDSGVLWMRACESAGMGTYRQPPYFVTGREKSTRDREFEIRWMTNSKGGGFFVLWHYVGFFAIPGAHRREMWMVHPRRKRATLSRR